MSTLTQDILKTLLHYEPETGVFTWRVRPKRGRVKAGDISACAQIGVFGRKYYAHRLAWFYMTGVWPKDEIDHINGNRQDNRWDNLREADRLINQQNQRRAYSNSRTGLQGSSPNSCGRFIAQITVRGQNTYIGVFSTAVEAHRAFLEAKRVLHEGCTI